MTRWLFTVAFVACVFYIYAVCGVLAAGQRDLGAWMVIIPLVLLALFGAGWHLYPLVFP